MKQRHVMSFLQSGFTTVEVSFDEKIHIESGNFLRMPISDLKKLAYEVDIVVDKRLHESLYQRGQRGQKRYTYKARISDNISVNDAVVVDSPSSGLVIVRVVAVHEKPQIDPDSNFDYKWIVQKVDTTRYQEIVSAEAKFREVMEHVEREAKREEMVEKFKTHIVPGSEAERLYQAAIGDFERIANEK